jgi:adenylylsulfate kinase
LLDQVSLLFADSTSLCITSFISPYTADKPTPLPFIEVFIDASLAECEKRDPKGLYKKARAGEIKSFTGVSDDAPYERPEKPEIHIDADKTSVDDAVKIIVDYLVKQGIVQA